MHPLAGQGVNLGFGDVTSLVNEIESAIETGRDIGDYSVLNNYEKDRKNFNLTTQTGVDLIKFLFGTSSFPISFVRNLGVNFVDHFPLLKVLFCFSLHFPFINFKYSTKKGVFANQAINSSK